MPKKKKGLVVFDLETTGRDPETDRIIQFAGKKFDDISKRKNVLSLVKTVDPDYPIEKEATDVHGYTNEDLKGAPKFIEIAGEIKEFIADCDLGGHNIIAYDVPLLMCEFKRAGIDFSIEGRRLVDSLEIFRHVLPHTLEAALNFFTGKDIVGAHDAMCDVITASEVIEAELREYDLTLDRAHEISMGDRLTLDGKIVKGEYGPILNFGKQKGKYLDDLAVSDPGLLRWVVKKDFSEETKKYMIRALLREFAKERKGE